MYICITYIYIHTYIYIYIYITGLYASPAAPTLEPCWGGNRRSRRRPECQWLALGQRRLSAGAQLGQEGRHSGGPEERRRCVEGHHHASLQARVGFPERLDGAARVGARNLCATSLDPRAVVYVEKAGCDVTCISHTATADAVKQISGTSMGISPSCAFKMEQPGARIERLLIRWS